MSVLDDWNEQRQAEHLTAKAVINTVAGDGTPGADPGGAIGWTLIIGGVAGTVLTAGAGWPLGVVAVAVGLVAIGGNRIVEHNLATMAEAAPEGQAALNRSAAGGCAVLVGYLVVGAAVLVGLFLLLAGAGLIAGVTL